MSLFSRIAGVFGSLFQIGGAAGPALKANSGNIDARNSSDSTYVNVRGLDPVSAQDFVTKTYGDTHYSGGTPATETVAGVVVLGAFCYSQITTGLVVIPAAGTTMLQAGNLDIEGDLDLSAPSDLYWIV